MKVLFWIGLMVLCSLSAQAKLTLASRGKALCTIVTQPGATPAERYAAEELAHTLKQITGAVFAIVEASANAPASAIIVGPGPLAKSLFPEVTLEMFGGEQLTIRTRGNRLLLAGGRPRGTLYAVYRFLQDSCGVRWWAPWASTIPHQASLAIPDLAVDARPAFESRDPFWFPAFDGDWAARNFSNSQSARLDEKHGGKITYKGFVHTFYPLVPPEKYYQAHPEWYSLIDGKRTTSGAQLCTTNPQLRDFMVERVKEWLRESPDANILSVSQNDCFGACQCPVCKAIDDHEGSYAGTMLSLVNYIAEKIGKEHPNVAIDTLAYQYTRKAPKTLKPLPNVIVRLCSIECNFAAPLEDPSNRAFADDIRDWSKRSDRLYIWDYTTNFAHYVLPHPNWFALGANVRFFHQNGARGLFEQGAYQSNGSEMSELRAWVLAQLLWNPYQDDRKLIDAFLDGYYGKPAARSIREYMDLLADRARGYYMSCYSSPSAPFLKFETLSRAERLWQQAEEAAKNDPDRLWRVRQGHLPVRYAWLTRWPQLRRECLQAGAAWPLPLSRKAVADAWLSTAIGPGPAGWTRMTLINEGGVTPEAFVARFAADPPEPVIAPLPKRGADVPLPTDIPGVEARTGVDVQDNLARLYNEGEYAEVRADPAASDGLAVWMPGSHHEWATQFPFSALPARVQKGRWQVWAAIRVEKAAGADPQAVAFTAGVYDSGAHAGRGEIAVRVGDASEKYRSYLLATVDANTSQYVWMAPTATSSINAVWVDRVYFVPAR
jgi:hypothetical protein